MKLDLDRTEHGRSEIQVAMRLALDWTEDRPDQAQVDGTLQVDNLDSRFLVNGKLCAGGSATCDRCLRDFQLTWDVPVEIVVLRDLETDEGEGDTMVLRQLRGELDLGDALRESVVLAYPASTVCNQECQGLCPACGIDRNQETCDCTEDDFDPRWAGLDALED